MSAPLGSGTLPVTRALRSANDRLRHEAADTIEQLYAALKECAVWVEWCINEHDAPDSSQEEAALKQAENAIAKARGDQ